MQKKKLKMKNTLFFLSFALPFAAFAQDCDCISYPTPKHCIIPCLNYGSEYDLQKTLKIDKESAKEIQKNKGGGEKSLQDFKRVIPAKIFSKIEQEIGLNNIESSYPKMTQQINGQIRVIKKALESIRKLEERGFQSDAKETETDDGLFTIQPSITDQFANREVDSLLDKIDAKDQTVSSSMEDLDGDFSDFWSLYTSFQDANREAIAGISDQNSEPIIAAYNELSVYTAHNDRLQERLGSENGKVESAKIALIGNSLASPDVKYGYYVKSYLEKLLSRDELVLEYYENKIFQARKLNAAVILIAQQL